MATITGQFNGQVFSAYETKLADELVSLQEQLEAINRRIASIQLEQQFVSGEDEVCKNALSMVGEAMVRLLSSAPHLVPQFKKQLKQHMSSIEEEFKSPEQLPPTTEQTATATPVPAPQPSEPEAIEVTATSVWDEPVSTNGKQNGNGNGKHYLSYADLKKLRKPTLIQLAKNLGVVESGGIEALVRRLDGMVIQSDLAAITQPQLKLKPVEESIDF